MKSVNWTLLNIIPDVNMNKEYQTKASDPVKILFLLIFFYNFYTFIPTDDNLEQMVHKGK